MKPDWAIKFSITKCVPLSSYWLHDLVYKLIGLTFKGEFGTTLIVLNFKELDALLGT